MADKKPVWFLLRWWYARVVSLVETLAVYREFNSAWLGSSDWFWTKELPLLKPCVWFIFDQTGFGVGGGDRMDRLSTTADGFWST